MTVNVAFGQTDLNEAYGAISAPDGTFECQDHLSARII
jgi:hypothetical protein